MWRIDKADDFMQIDPAERFHTVFEEHVKAVELLIGEIGREVDLIYTGWLLRPTDWQPDRSPR